MNREYAWFKKLILNKPQRAMIHETFPKEGLARGVVHRGNHQIWGPRQTCRSNSSAGEVSLPVFHHYWSEQNCNSGLLPHNRPTLSALHRETSAVQGCCGQVMIGIIKKAQPTSQAQNDVQAKDICPHLILTHPIKGKHGHQIPFCNCLHYDPSDYTDEETGRRVQEYLSSTAVPQKVREYCQCMKRTFRDRLPGNRFPLPTTCPIVLNKQPDHFGIRLNHFFVTTETNTAWNVSSNIFCVASKV